MKLLSKIPFAIAVYLYCLTSAPGTLHAQAAKIFVASYGNDANDGSRGSPKRNFQAAHTATAAGGQICVLDTAGYGTLSITKSIAITVPPGVTGFVTATGSNNGITIAAATTDIVTLRGLIIEGGGAGAGANGIFANPVGTLIVEDCTIRNFAVGTYLYNTNGAHLTVLGGGVRNTQIGIEIRAATSGVTVDGVIDKCAVDNASQTAIYAETNGSGTIAKLTARGCVVTHSGNGLQALGSGSTIYADTNIVSGNTVGIATVSGANALSRVNNVFTNNVTDGAFPGGSLPGK